MDISHETVDKMLDYIKSDFIDSGKIVVDTSSNSKNFSHDHDDSNKIQNNDSKSNNSNDCINKNINVDYDGSNTLAMDTTTYTNQCIIHSNKCTNKYGNTFTIFIFINMKSQVQFTCECTLDSSMFVKFMFISIM